MGNAKVPGLSALVVKDRTVLWEGHYGWANISEKRRVTSDTLFQIASVSKTITACAVMQQVELNLDGDVNELLPFNFRNPEHPGKAITVRQLITHTSGIRDNWGVLEDTWVTNQDFPISLGKSLAKYFLKDGEYYDADANFYKWAPGSRSQYSNVGTTLAAGLAEVMGKRSFEKLCETQIFEPLKIEGSSFRLADVDLSRLAIPYEYRKKLNEYNELGHHGYLDFPAGSLRIRARDLARFLLMFMDDGIFDGVQVMKESTVQEMKRIQYPKIDSDQGLIWYYEKFGDKKMLGHTGGDPGVASMMFYDQKDKVGFIVLMNAEPKNGSFEDALAEQLLKHVRLN